MAVERERPALKAEVYRRTDGRWAWRVLASNGEVIATDGGQGYENRADAAQTLFRLAPHAVVVAEAEDES